MGGFDTRSALSGVALVRARVIQDTPDTENLASSTMASPNAARSVSHSRSVRSPHGCLTTHSYSWCCGGGWASGMPTTHRLDTVQPFVPSHTFMSRIDLQSGGFRSQLAHRTSRIKPHPSLEFMASNLSRTGFAGQPE
jgi:hypothetical protein